MISARVELSDCVAMLPVGHLFSLNQPESSAHSGRSLQVSPPALGQNHRRRCGWFDSSRIHKLSVFQDSELLREIGANHVSLKHENGFSNQEWDRFQEIMVEVILKQDGVKQSKETSRAWRLLICAFIELIRDGFDAQVRQFRRKHSFNAHVQYFENIEKWGKVFDVLLLTYFFSDASGSARTARSLWTSTHATKPMDPGSCPSTKPVLSSILLSPQLLSVISPHRSKASHHITPCPVFS